MSNALQELLNSPDYQSIADAGEDLKAASGLLHSAALALRSASYAEVREPVRGLLASAKAALSRAQEPGLQIGHPEASEIASNIAFELFRLYSSILVAEAALNAPEPVDGDGMCVNPLADLLEICAEMAGEEVDQGLYGRTEKLLGQLYRTWKAKAPELVGPVE